MDTDTLVYLDHAATTPVLPEVMQRMAEVLAMPGNAAANHAAGRAADAVVQKARAQVAALVGAAADNIVFTSGATESNNLAINGTVRAAQARGSRPHVITLATEHKSVLEPVRAWQGQGVAATVLRPGAGGLLDPAALAEAIRPETCLVSLLQVNNETGVTQHLPRLIEVCAARQVPLHVDAAQAAGKLPVDVAGVALLSFTAHKVGGPQGVGALYVAPSHRGRIVAQQLGGGHERGLRAGTLATHLIAGFGLACEIAAHRRQAEAVRLGALRDELWRRLASLPGALLNGDAAPRAPHILNVTFDGVEGESLFTSLAGLALATGSACNSRSGEPSYVLRALGRDTAQAQGSLRFSLGWSTTAAGIAAAAAEVQRVHTELWLGSPARPAPLQGWEGAPHRLGEAGAVRLGTWVRFAACLDGDRIREARVQWYGCPHVAAACRHVAARLQGQPVTAPEAGSPEEWRNAAGAPVEKLGAMLIIEDALAALCRPPSPRI